MGEYSPVNKHCGCNHCGDRIAELETLLREALGAVEREAAEDMGYSLVDRIWRALSTEDPSSHE